MAFSNEYRDFVVEQFGRVVPVQAKAMFGGVGLYSEGLFFALIAEDRTYLKVDDSNRPDFEAAGMSAFVPYGEKPMKYFELPGELLEDVSALRPWLEKAVGVARNAKRRGR